MTGAAFLTVLAAMAVAGFIPALMLVISGRWGAAALAPGAFALVAVISGQSFNGSYPPDDVIGMAALTAAGCGLVGYACGAASVMWQRRG